MFDFFFKRKKIILDFFTDDLAVYECAKPNYGSKFMPDWWKNTHPMTLGDQFGAKNGLSIKNCSGLTEFYRRGIVLPSWSHIMISIPPADEKEKALSAVCGSLNFRNESHPPIQYKLFAKDDGFNYKISYPWSIKANKKAYFIWSQPTWSVRDRMFNLVNLPACINFYNQYNASINFFYKRTHETQLIEILPLEPLVIIHALNEEDVELRYHLLDSREYNFRREAYKKLFISEAYPKHLTEDQLKGHNQIFGSYTADDRLKLYKRYVKLRDKTINKINQKED